MEAPNRTAKRTPTDRSEIHILGAHHGPTHAKSHDSRRTSTNAKASTRCMRHERCAGELFAQGGEGPCDIA